MIGASIMLTNNTYTPVFIVIVTSFTDRNYLVLISCYKIGPSTTFLALGNLRNLLEIIRAEITPLLVDGIHYKLIKLNGQSLFISFVKTMLPCNHHQRMNRYDDDCHVL